MKGCAKVTRGISGSSNPLPERTVVFQYFAKVGSYIDVWPGDGSADIPKIFSMAGPRVGRQATIIPRRGTMHESIDFQAELWVGSPGSRSNSNFMRIAIMATMLGHWSVTRPVISIHCIRPQITHASPSTWIHTSAVFLVFDKGISHIKGIGIMTAKKLRIISLALIPV